jgi:hypothetical protein
MGFSKALSPPWTASVPRVVHNVTQKGCARYPFSLHTPGSLLEERMPLIAPHAHPGVLGRKERSDGTLLI